MPNAVHRSILVELADLDFGSSFADLDSLPDGDLAWSAPVTTLGACDYADVFAQLKVGTTPTAGGTIEFYAGGGDGGGTTKRVGTDDIDTTDHGKEATAGDVTRVLGTLGGPAAVIAVDATSNKIYTVRFRLWYPGPDLTLFVANNTGVAFNGTSSPHSISVRGWGPEIQ